MLAKLWKKILLFICVVAILFNITAKLVRRTNLKEQLQSVTNGSSLSEMFNKKEEKTINEQEKENKKTLNNTEKKENEVKVNKVKVIID